MGTSTVRRFKLFLICLPAVLLVSMGAARAGDYVPRNSPKRIQDAVDDLTARLALQEKVTAVVVQNNALLVSVERQKTGADGFVLSFEDGFMDGLDEDELRAIVAHELGHVWIFTHHPYLQTELLANHVAMRVVSRDSLQKVYSKVWERGGTKGDLSRFLGR